MFLINRLRKVHRSLAIMDPLTSFLRQLARDGPNLNEVAVERSSQLFRETLTQCNASQTGRLWAELPQHEHLHFINCGWRCEVAIAKCTLASGATSPSPIPGVAYTATPQGRRMNQVAREKTRCNLEWAWHIGILRSRPARTSVSTY